ncbi:MAG: uroporphyrinogen decarboxylase family protein [Phycisphaeraceae bacterium]|nr:uroporphyrinogen decarboxylase family protein [Phycisphaeraceae bacterium]
MTPYQRYAAVLKGKPVDYLPRIPILMQFAAEYDGSNYADFASDYRARVEANLACVRDFGVDQLSTMSDAYCETHAFGSQIKYIDDGPPHSTHPLEENSDLSQLLKPNPQTSERMVDRLMALRLYKQLQGNTYPILGWVEGAAAEAADLRNMTGFMMDLIDDEVYACALMERCLEVAIEFAQAQVDAGADTIGIGDAVASQVSPDIYERLIQPREKILTKAIQSMGATARLHICGNMTHLLPGIADLGVDILDVDHMVDMATVRRQVGSQVVLAGNIDPVSGVLRGTPKTIRDSIRETYQTVGNPYLVNAGCEIPAKTPIENFKALCEPLPYQA